MTCKDCFFYGCCILNRCSADADVSGCKVFELESLERKKDLVEVVRCRDCIYAERSEDGDLYCDGPIGIFGTVGFNDFCSYGERGEGE